ETNYISCWNNKKYTQGVKWKPTRGTIELLFVTIAKGGSYCKPCPKSLGGKGITLFNDKVVAGSSSSIVAKIALMANLSWNGSDALTESRESKPKLYDGNTILKMDTIVIPDSDGNIMLCEESHSKMLLKEQDPFEHAYWKATSVPALDPSHSSTTVIVEVPKELPKVRVRLSTSASGSQPSGNTRNDRILQTPINGSAVVQNLKKQDNSDYVSINRADYMSSDNLCVSNSMNDVKFRA
ncbi:hypothetical protein Tco_0657582, partial [Tanacetum coccineum]